VLKHLFKPTLICASFFIRAMKLDGRIENVDASVICALLKTLEVSSSSVKLILFPCVYTVYNRIGLKMFLVIYSEIH
jgi:hypothetical protein